jgi:hypothetical protein
MDLEISFNAVKVFTIWAQEPENTYYVFALNLIVFVIFIVLFEIGSMLKKRKFSQHHS